MGEHTPGPWVWDWGQTDNLYSQPHLDQEKADRAKGEYFHLEAIVETDNRAYGPNDADAALIAAAPDMLGALKAVVAVWNEYPGMQPSDDVATKVFAAIAKAEGKP